MAGGGSAGGEAALLGQPRARVEGPVKVTGTAVFPGDARPPGTAFAAPLTSPIARGRITRIDPGPALALPGVLDVLTCEVVGEAVRPVKHAMAGGWANSTHRPLASPAIRYGGQIVAMVVGETLEAAQEGTRAVRLEVEAEPG